MITLAIDRKQIRKLEQSLGDKVKRLDRELEIAINATGKSVIKEMGSADLGIRSQLAVKQSEIKRVTSFQRARRPRLTAVVTLEKQRRIWLQAFGARQVKTGGGGVSYRTDPNKGRQRVPSAFLINPTGHVYKRQSKARGPLIALHGASPWGAFKKRKLRPRIEKFGNARLHKEVAKRIRTNVLKSKGAI